MAKDAQPELPIAQDAPDAPDEPRRTRRVISDKRLGSANDIMRILSELGEPERKAVMQIVNLLIEAPSNSNEESE